MNKKYNGVFSVLLLSMVMVISHNVFAEDTPSQSSTGLEVKTFAPISVERKNIDGMEYLTKIYEVPKNIEESAVEENDFELETFLFKHFKTEMEEKESKESKEVSEEMTLETGSNDMSEILQQFPTTKEFYKEEYKGNLYLDTKSITTEVKGYKNQSYTVSTTQEYNGLMYQDTSVVPKTAVKNGTTLPLTNINWVVTGTGLSGDTLVPTEHRAIASYGKSFTKQVPTGYVSTARYTGEVTKTNIDKMIYKVTYQGEVMQEPVFMNSMVKKEVVPLLLGVLFLGASGTLFVLTRNKNRVKIYNLTATEYICLGNQKLVLNNPVIDLNRYENMIQSNSFVFVINKKNTKNLFGKRVMVILKDTKIKHRVTGYLGEYKFELKLGGVADAK